MYETKPLQLSKNTKQLFDLLLLLYPMQYRNQFGLEMWFAFQDLYQEELQKKGSIRIQFWFAQIADILKSIIEQHINEIQKKGIKKYLQQTLYINNFNIIGGLFLLPAFLVLCIDIISRIAQGDLVHFNRPVYNLLSHTFLYSYPVLFTWVIIFPVLAVLLNSIPLAKNIAKKHGHILNARFLLQNVITLALVFFATFFILIVKFHDFGPCMLHGIVRFGFEQLFHIITVCKNA